ncbi:MAG: LamG domain-containing protein, partial [Gammaproteobacteria bacterium]|nr:LamG domain-containing protein [Gammaproteobacteria bacterium]
SGSNRYLRMRIKAGGTTTTFADSSVNLTTGQWYFAVGTYDATSGDMKLYLDGAEVASAPHAVGGPVDAGPTVPVAIGANGTVERFFDGLLDDVRVYDRALSATEISDLFAAASAGGSKLLFVVGNVSSPGMTSEELAHQTLIESWGYTVELIDDDASQADFDNAVANNDVVFTTNDITASRLNTKLVNATIGVVTSEDNLSDEFGLSSSIAWESGSVVEINDNSHYITSPFPLGVLTILSGSESLAYVTGTLSPDLGQLASSSSGYGVVTLDAGASMYGGGPAAGRRVQLPWGGNGFDPNNLTTDGSTILQRALEWGAGAGAAAMGPIAHWKLDDGTGLTAVDSEGGHDGTLTSGPAWVAGQLGDALDFDGADDYVDLTSDAELDDVFVGGATAMAWIEPASWGNNGYGRIFDKSTSPSATGDGWAIRLNKDNGGLNFGQGFTGGRGWWRFAESSINFNTWHHVALAYDASSTANDPTVYLDGSPVAVTRVDTPSGDIRSDASINLHLGNHASSAATFFDGKIDDARIYDRILDATEIADIAAGGGGGGGGGGGPGYNETYAPWSAPNNDTWEAVDLGAFGVPANAVVEVAVVNSSTNTHLWGGVRAVGSTLNRRLQLHEAESGGTDVMVMTVQADASSRIEHYSDSGSNPTFILLGYWGSGTFVEAWDFFNAGASSSWRDHALATYGVSPGHVAEILVHNDTTNNEYQGGVRTNGSTASRRFDIHEPEGGGKDMITMLVNAGTDDGATIEVAAESDSGIDFYLMGHWSTPPGVYTEAFAALSGSPTSSGAWDDKDLTSLGVPASAVAQIVLANGQDSAEAELGIRGKGSSLDRTFDLQEAESGGDDLASMHVNTDGSSTIQWYDQNTGQDHRFYVLGWWVLSP